MKRIFRSLAALLIIVISFSAISFAWLASGKYLNFPSSFGGSATPAYFAGGDGSFEKPFRITNAVHLYNLAWLQYLGYFNRREGFNNDRDQTYFELGKDVDMRGRAIPPIGTEEYPFIGKFNGNGKTVKNLTISNKKGTGDLVYAPTNAKFSNNILRFVDDTKSHDIEIVGMFGVTGNYDGYFNKYKAGGHTVDGTIASVSNFYVDKIHVRSNSAKTLAGLAAGYIGGNFSNVGVYRSDIKFAANAQANGVAGVGVLSKYSLVGAYNEDLITWDDAENGWGNSIDMKSFYDRLDTFYKNPTNYYDFTYNQTTDTNKLRYYGSDEVGSAYISKSGEGEPTYRLRGGLSAGIYETAGKDGYYIYAERNTGTSKCIALTIEGNNVIYKLYEDFNAAKPNIVTWYFDNNNKMFAYVGGENTKRYVKCTNNDQAPQLTLVNENEATQFINDSKGLKAYNKYFIYSLGIKLASQPGRSPTFKCNASNEKHWLNTNAIYNIGERSIQTYLPISVDKDNKAVTAAGQGKPNTGYIASGIVSGGAIRVKPENKTCITNMSKEGVLTIKEGEQKEAVNSSLLAFDETWEKFSPTLNNNKIYGLHFMSSQFGVGKDNIYEAKKAYILGKEYSNYEMTANSIDFHVQQSGSIKFFAGTYYDTGENVNNFFSLYHIKRNGEKIDSVKEIDKIYSSGGDCVYLYTDNTTSSGVAIPSGCELKFDCEWISNPTVGITKKSLYYFEIPVNKGEYALGSAKEGDGAYLLYLDIGANGEGSGETGYTMDKVRFVNSGMPSDGNGNVNLSAYKPALITLSGSSTAEETAVFKRDEQETDGKLKLAYRIINNNANAINVNETTTGMTREDPDLQPSKDTDT